MGVLSITNTGNMKAGKGRRKESGLYWVQKKRVSTGGGSPNKMWKRWLAFWVSRNIGKEGRKRGNPASLKGTQAHTKYDSGII